MSNDFSSLLELTDTSALCRGLDALETLGDEHLDTLLKLLEHESWRVRVATARALSRHFDDVPDTTLHRLMGHALTDPSPWVRATLLDIATRHDPTARIAPGVAAEVLAPAPGRADEVRQRAVLACFERYGESLPHEGQALVLELLGAEEAPIRAEAAHVASNARITMAVDTLEGLLVDDEPRVREAAARALSVLGPNTPDALLLAASDSEREVRRAAVEALGHVRGAGSSEVEDRLLEVVGSDDHELRAVAVYALGQLEAPSAKRLAALVDRMHDEQSLVRTSAIQAVDALSRNTPSVGNLLSQLLLKTPQLERRGLVLRALDAVEPDVSVDAVDAALLELAFDARDPIVRASAGWILAATGQQSQALSERLVEGLSAHSAKLRWRGAEVLRNVSRPLGASVDALVVEALHDPAAHVRRLICEALLSLQPAGSFPRLVRRVFEGDPRVPRLAQGALIAFRDQLPSELHTLLELTPRDAPEPITEKLIEVMDASHVAKFIKACIGHARWQDALALKRGGVGVVPSDTPEELAEVLTLGREAAHNAASASKRLSARAVERSRDRESVWQLGLAVALALESLSTQGPSLWGQSPETPS